MASEYYIEEQVGKRTRKVTYLVRRNDPSHEVLSRHVTEDQAQVWIDKQATGQPEPQSPAPQSSPPTGWSNAARARRGGSHPLGTAVGHGPGCTVYRDDFTGHGTVRIYDES